MNKITRELLYADCTRKTHSTLRYKGPKFNSYISFILFQDLEVKATLAMSIDMKNMTCTIFTLIKQQLFSSLLGQIQTCYLTSYVTCSHNRRHQERDWFNSHSLRHLVNRVLSMFRDDNKYTICQISDKT